MTQFKLSKTVEGLLSSVGYTIENVLKELKITPLMSLSDHMYLSSNDYGRFLEFIAKKSHYSEFCMEILTTNVRPNDLGVFGLLFIYSENLESALKRFSKFKKIIGPEEIKLIKRPDLTRIEFAFLCPEFIFSNEILQGSMAFVVNTTRLQTNHQFKIKNIYLKAKKINSSDIFLKIFGVLPKLNQKVNALEFETSMLNLNFIQSTPILTTLLEKQANILIKEVDNNNDLLFQTKAILETQFDGSKPSIKRVAKALAISERSLQEKLAALNSSFRLLLEEARKKNAILLLEKTNIEIAEIAFLLGYSNQTSFTRAFKIWFLKAPGEFRDK